MRRRDATSLWVAKSDVIRVFVDICLSITQGASLAYSLGPANVYRISCGEAPCARGQSGTPLAATNDIVGGQRLQAA